MEGNDNLEGPFSLFIVVTIMQKARAKTESTTELRTEGLPFHPKALSDTLGKGVGIEKRKKQISRENLVRTLSLLQMQIKIHTHTRYLTPTPLTHIPHMFLANLQTSPISLKTCSSRVYLVEE